jgi:hypothetical protein
MEWYLVIPMLLGAMLYGAIARRVMGGVGGKWPGVLGKTQRTAVVLMAGLPFAFPAFFVTSWLVASAVLAGTAAIVSLGDGDQTDLGSYDGPEPDAPFWDKILGHTDNSRPYNERRRRDFHGLFASGAVTALPATITLIVTGNILAGLALLVLGTGKAPAYALAYEIPSRAKNLLQGRELGEAIWGATAGLAGAVALLLL